MSVWNAEFSVEDYGRIIKMLKVNGFDQPSLELQVSAALTELLQLRRSIPAPDADKVRQLEDELKDASICVDLNAATLRKHRAKVALDEARAGK